MTASPCPRFLPRPARAARGAALALALPALLLAQAAKPTTPETAEKIVELSPFVISEDSNLGYAATSTLAGTRLKTDLKDLGAAITVVTAQFMKDTGVTNLEELLTYTPSTEIGGPLGNYSAGGFVDSAGRADQDSARRDPQSGARVRGFASPNFTRSYFSTSISSDAYNVEGVTFSRGANSLLFGLGSAGGVIDTGLKSAIIGRNSGEITFRYGSQGSNRSTADYNTTLIPRRLALRVSLMHKNENYKQEPAYDRESRVYAALNAVVFENKNSNVLGKTVVRANFEAGEGSRNPPSAFAPQLAYESFFLPPPNYTPYTGQDYPLGGGYAMLTANWRKWAVNDTRRREVSPGVFQPGWYESFATAVRDGRPDLVAQNHSSSHIFQQIGIVYNGTGAARIGIPGSTAAGFQGWISQEPGQNAFTAGHINTRAYQDGGQSVGFKVPTLTDTNVFDYRNNLLTAGLQDINRRFDAASVTLEQSFFRNRLGFEATLDKQFFHIDYYQPFGGNNRNVPVYVDTTLYLSDGTPNPNVGRAFMFSQNTSDQWRNTARTNQRVTSFFDLNFKDLNPTLGKWLGRHTFTGLWQKESVETKGLNYNMYLQGVNFDLNRSLNGITAGTGLSNALQNPAILFAYLSDDLRGKEMNQVRLNQFVLPRPQDGETFTTSYYDLNTQLGTPVGTQPRTFKTGTVVYRRLANGGQAFRTDVTSKALAWQSRLLGENIVGLVGWREDKIENFRQIATNGRAANNEYLASNLRVNNVPATTSTGRTFTWSAVGHLPRKWVEKLPSFISSVSAHYGVGENFQAISERRSVNNQAIPSPSGTTTEQGVLIGFMSNKWTLKINRFESDSRYAGVNAGFVSTSITEVTRALNNYRAAENSGLAFNQLSSFPSLSAAGYSSYDQLYTAIKNLIPQPTRALYDYQIINNTWQLPNGGGVQGLAATTDVVAKGWEVELTANPLRNWRISLNATQVEATNSNSATDHVALQAAYVKNLNDSKLANIVEGPASITTFLGRYTQEDIAPLVLLRSKDGAVSQELRKHRVNVSTNYDFPEGRLKGFGLGGSLRWQSKVAIGYATQLNNLNQQVPILSRPFFGPDELNGDVWFTYSRKLTEKIRWKAQLNFRNAIGTTSDIPVAADPDGKRSVYRIAPEKQWFLTNTFSF
ncbi:MAG: TonB-dependent receptor plug domain-containing protein [Opitutaceae bacterium]|nr:TonB-dependent receptor plug domain-containing protein [Opitutaceae bacterium]